MEVCIVVQQDTKTPWSILRHGNYDDDDLNLQVFILIIHTHIHTFHDYDVIHSSLLNKQCLYMCRQVPASISEVSPMRPNQSTELSESASKFLLRLAKHAIKELDHPVNHAPELSSTSTGSNAVQPDLFSSVTARSLSPTDSSLEG